MILTKSRINEVDLDFRVNGKIESGKLEELLLIVPTNRKIRYMKGEIISHTPSKSSGKLNLETLGTFSTNLLFIDYSNKEHVLSEAASYVLLKQCFNKVHLKYFSNYKNEIPFGTLERIKNVISEYKKHGISPELLRNEAENLTGSEKIKAEDIADIFEAYLEKCRNLYVKEIGDIYFEVNELEQQVFDKRFQELYPKVNLIVINGFDEFTSPEIRIINSLSMISGITLFISFDYYSYNYLIFSHLDKCYKQLLKQGFKVIKDISVVHLGKFREDAREYLFNNKKKKFYSNYKSDIIKISAATREKEIESIAKEIKNLITDENVEPDNICVVFNLIHKYSSILRDIFTLYGLPFNLTDRYSLSNSPPVISIINFLEILENDFYYKNIFRALSGGDLQIPGIDLSNLLKVSINLKVISGLNNWYNSLHDAIAQTIDNTDDDEKASFNRLTYQKALNDIKKLDEYLAPFGGKLTFQEFLNYLNNLIFSLDLPSKLINDGGDSIEKNIKALTTFLNEVTELMNLFEMEYGKNAKFPLKFFLNNIRTAVASSRYNVKEKPGFGVQITTLNEIRGLRFDYLFIAGICDGDLPTRYAPEIFYSGSYFKKEDAHQTEERYHFYQSLCSWNKKLYLTFPAHEEKKELVPSNFLTEFSNLFALTERELTDYSDTIFSKAELLTYTGLKGVDRVKGKWNQNETGLNLESIQKAININEKRMTDPFGESEYTGLVKSDTSGEIKKYLESLKGKDYSITQLETYAKCPYKYFAERILMLKPMEEPTEEIEALEMGTLLHAILFEFYKKLKRKNITLQNCNADDFITAGEIIFSIAAEKIESANFNSPLTFYEKEKILGINGDRRNSILYKFIEEERIYDDGFIPEYFEFGFGFINDENNEKHSSINLKAGDVNIRGKIDRIDVNKKDSTYKVIDYKLGGKKPVKGDLLEGLSLQLPIYMYAAKELIKVQLEKDFDPAGAEIYSLKFNNKEFGRNLIKTIDLRKKFSPEELRDKLIGDNEKMIQISLDAVKNYVNSIVKGKFNLSTLNDRENRVCRYCSFKPVCRIQDAN